MTELTNEQKAKIFAMYWGQRVLKFSKTAPATQYVDEYMFARIDKECVLALTPLSAISDEHAIEVAKMNRYTASDDSAICAKVGRDILKRCFVENPVMCLPYECADKLRQWGYALPYNGIDLFEAGIAIDKTTLK